MCDEHQPIGDVEQTEVRRADEEAASANAKQKPGRGHARETLHGESAEIQVFRKYRQVIIFLRAFMYQNPRWTATEVKLNMEWKKIGFGASLVSIVASIGIYFNGDQELGIFVGLWASAILLLSERMAEMQAE